MHLYLVRHGEAVSDVEDPKRPLSSNGKAALKELCETLRNFEIRVHELRHSQKLRAQETAQILAEAITSEGGVREVSGLNPNDDILPLVEELEVSEQDLMLVGHLPFMDLLASRLLTGKDGQQITPFQTGEIICLERLSPDHWQVDWKLHPSLFLQ